MPQTIISPVDVFEGQIKGVIGAGVTPYQILTAFQNTMCHGEGIAEAGGTLNDEDLEKLHKCLDKARQCLKRME